MVLTKAFFAEHGRRGALAAKEKISSADRKRWGKTGGQTRWVKRKQEALNFLMSLGCSSFAAEIIVKHAGPQSLLKARKEHKARLK